MEKKVLTSDKLPDGLKNLPLPFSPAVKAGDFIFMSGYPGFVDRKTGVLPEGIEAQTKETLEVIRDLLEDAGSSLEKVVKATVLLKNTQDYWKMNEVYGTFFPKDPPSRSTIVTELPKPGMLIEIECTAVA